ncbi:iron-sulfur cluster assembly accessory protein [Aphanizomenon flos-aquae NRERC-008]|jgi:iron-sulfur cluster assembly protein|uniref:Iron-sulfur cluster assembly accessory protein n=1 Tax=Aphanizomenon flos-aquae FACHB-1249 TaxID=2692889 RepID=A0ABR8IR05_APHFL|nr:MULTISPECIES: iron-sulfur cluster assembly accessory protein [Aphanizomenon]MCE2907166.1 iron-sulfur cluster assembly accessory protein [Anabaena sp. CoA2_C59]MDJ0507237.1 iron-sulfur cluster assembly accessory protein [Nostocales cyanobacterium LE14-WE12]MBD2390448.1 iron-sulfur cluster assembly accessory protein [Aphanizomenon flos-aquae FACHB-1171]MBD2555953.1 iron-sulfur cluster assembly accessory protein [Aphanizomenon flos-aquae FACHB-1290]MBD2631515.1 iron-sulfur cluster assembly acc
MIYLSPAAINEIERLKSKQPSNILFRLRVKSGGCADWFYDLAFDTTVQPQDQVLELQNLRVIIDPESLNYINELSLDYSEDLMGGGFRFHNPQATSTCSCGNSFSVSQ